MTQEDFGDVSSRTYVSSLERAQKSPTLDKIEELAAAMKVHPLTLLVLTWAGPGDLTKLLEQVTSEIARVRNAGE